MRRSERLASRPRHSPSPSPPSRTVSSGSNALLVESLAPKVQTFFKPPLSKHRSKASAVHPNTPTTSAAPKATKRSRSDDYFVARCIHDMKVDGDPPCSYYLVEWDGFPMSD